MKKIVDMFQELHEDRNGAAFIEYTALLGVILAVGLLVLTQVGAWANLTWTYLCNQLSTANAACVPTA